MTKTISHHPDASTLMSFAAASLPDALAAVVAAHLDVCPACQREVRAMERVGATLFEGLSPASMAQRAPAMEMRRQDADIETKTRPATASEVPRPLSRLMGGASLDTLAWRRLGIGVWHCKLPTTAGDLRLLRVGPGRRMPEHGHGGSELTLMLRGSYSDETGTYRAGDVADLDGEIEHTPVADPEVGCICLIASEKPARFKGLIPRLVQPLTGM
jgi:putative transcriptional regulator